MQKCFIEQESPLVGRAVHANENGNLFSAFQDPRLGVVRLEWWVNKLLITLFIMERPNSRPYNQLPLIN